MIKIKVTTPLTEEDIKILNAIGSIRQSKPTTTINTQLAKQVAKNVVVEESEHSIVEMTSGPTIPEPNPKLPMLPPKLTAKQQLYLETIHTAGTWLTAEEIAERMEVTNSATANTMLRKLIKAKLLIRKREVHDGYGGSTPYKYRLTNLGRRSINVKN